MGRSNYSKRDLVTLIVLEALVSYDYEVRLHLAGIEGNKH